MTTHGRPSFAPLFLEPFDLPNPEVRDVARGKAGVYVLRQRGTVRYVGSSVPGEKGGEHEPLRLWKTILRHFQRCKGAAAGRYGFGDDNFCTHDRNEWEIAIYDTSTSDARKVEQDLIEHYKPTDQPKHTSDKRKTRKPKNAGKRRNPLSKEEMRAKLDAARAERAAAAPPPEPLTVAQPGDIRRLERERAARKRAAAAARKKNPPRRPKKGRRAKKRRMGNPYDNADDRKTAFRFLKLATSGHRASMLDACKQEDANGDFDDATVEELAEILGMWARDALE